MIADESSPRRIDFQICWPSQRAGRLGVERGLRSGPGEIKGSTCNTFEEAKAAFECAWLAFASSRTEAEFLGVAQSARLDCVEIPMHDLGLKIPTQSDSRTRCFSGAEITTPMLTELICTDYRRSRGWNGLEYLNLNL